jgi:hypothetical protein
VRESKGRIFRVQLGLIAGLLACLSIPTVAAFAASPSDAVIESIVMSPVSKHYEINAGASTSDTFKIINDGRVGYDFVVYARPYSVSSESYQPDFISKPQNADAYKWVQFDKPSYHIEPGQTIEVPYTVRVPKGSTPGGHYGVLFAETQPSGDTQGNVVKRTKRVGAILYMTVKGDVRTGGTLKSVDVPFFQFNRPLTTAQRVKNNGNVDFTATTNMGVYDIFGGEKFKTAREYPVLPSTTRRAAVEWPNASWIGFYRVELTTSFLDTKSSSTHYVLLVPLWVYLTLALLIGARVLYAVARRKKNKKK